MTVTYDDFLKYRWGKEKKSHSHEEQQQRTMARVAGVQMKELMNKPDWKLYLDHVNLVLDKATKEMESYKVQLLEKEDPDTRRDYTFSKGVVQGLTSALECGKTVVRRAEQIVEEGDVRRNQETS